MKFKFFQFHLPPARGDDDKESTIKSAINTLAIHKRLKINHGHIELRKQEILVRHSWSLFEVTTDVLLFMQSKTTETTSRALCDPHSADLKVL